VLGAQYLYHLHAAEHAQRSALLEDQIKCINEDWRSTSLWELLM
jgi:hypothetical protein